MMRRTGEAGFTLVELVIVIGILGMVAAAILGVYMLFQQTYTRASSLEGAQLGARAGADRMATELGLIGSFWQGATDATAAITAATATTITFMADVDGDSVVNGAETTVLSIPNSTTINLSGTATDVGNAFTANEFIYIANGANREVKQIASVAGTTINLSNPLTLPIANYLLPGSIVRSVETVTYNFDAAANSLTRTVGGSGAQGIVENVTGLTLTYFDINGVVITNPALISEIQITLTTQGPDGSPRTMTSYVNPRNLP